MAVLTAFRGDLGTDSGVPQSIYKLDTSKMTQIRKADGKPLAQALLPGQRLVLPGKQGSISFDGVRRYATLQVAHDPGKTPALLAAALALVGLLLSLFVRRRRVWVRAVAGPGGVTLVEVAGLARVEGEDRDGLTEQVDGLAAALGHERTSTTDEETT
jgi:cytochrome c biogenesis protein